MRDIKILGTGCPKCRKLEERMIEVADELSLDCEIEKVEDIEKIMSYGVMMTPALVIDGQIKTTGKVPAVEELRNMLTEN